MIESTAAVYAEAVLEDHSRDAVGEALLALPEPLEDVDLSLARVRQAFAALPAEVLAEIAAFGRHVDSPGVLHLRNLPTDPTLPSTPVDGRPSPLKRTFVSEGVLLGLTELVGLPLGFHTEKEGGLIHDIVPVAAGATTQTNQGSKVFLTFHNDLVHDPSGRYDKASPDFIILVCVRPDPEREATTYYADARRVLEELPPELVRVLRGPRFRLNAPGGYVHDFAGGEEVLSEPLSLIDGPIGAPEIRLAANGVRPVDVEAERALEVLSEACQAVSHEVRLATGEALLINNRKGVHARSSFPARHDGTDRWLQRTYVRRELWSIRERAMDGDRWLH